MEKKDTKEIQKYNFTNGSLSIIDECDILSDEDFNKLVEMRDGLEHGFEKGQVFRTEYEARNSVLVDAKFCTPDAKFWQSTREQSVHFNELISLSFEYRKSVVKLARTGIKKARLQRRLDKGEYEIEIERVDLELRIKDLTIEEERTTWVMVNQKRTAVARMREIEQWHVIKEELLPDLEFGTEDCGAHQHKSYLYRFVRQAELLKEGKAALSGPEAINFLSQLESAVAYPKNRKTVEGIYGDNLRKQLDG